VPAPGGLFSAPGITNADLGKTLHYKVGETFSLALRAMPGYNNWMVEPIDTAVLAAIPNPAAAAIRGMTLRAFRALAPGQVVIRATSSPDCQSSPQAACPANILQFNVTVVVSG
jgi:hypothetical protein